MPVEYTGAGAVRHNYGPILSPQTKPDPAPSREKRYGSEVELEINFTFDNLPAWSATAVADAVKQTIPALSAITDVKLIVQETWVGGTSLEIGTVRADTGAAVDVDGFIPAAVGVTANLVAGYVISGRGAQVLEAPDAPGTAHNDADGVFVAAATGPISTLATLVSVVAVGTYTAGRARLLVRYIPSVG